MVGKAVEAVGSIVKGEAAKAAGKYTRKVMDVNAVNAERDGAAQVQRIRDVARLSLGRQVAGMAGSGFTIGSGSALDALFESQVESEIDIATTRRKAKGEAMSFTSQGAIAYAEGQNAQIAGYVGAAKAAAEAVEDYVKAGG